VVAGVPALLQALDWYVHRLTGAPVTGKALLSISVFTLISAVFHLHVMRNGVFLSGRGNSLVNDFRRIPALIAGFAMKPLTLFAGIESRIGMKVENG
jgi:MFS superfamily sulfate permease-like transporter